MKIKAISGLFLALLITISATSFSDNKGASMLQGKPYFSVRVDISGCRYQVRLNDVPFIENDKGLPVTVNFPVNELITKGDNELSIFVMPLTDDIYEKTTAELTDECNSIASLQVRKSGTDEQNNQTISKISFHGNAPQSQSALDGTSSPGNVSSTNAFINSNDGDVLINQVKLESWNLYKEEAPKFDLPEYFNFEEKTRKPIETGIKISQIINFESSLPEWKWLNGEIIKPNNGTKKEIYQEHIKLQNLILSKNISPENLYPLFAERTIELSQAYYSSEEEMVPDGIIESANDDKYELVKLEEIYENEKNIFLNTYGNNRLAKLSIWNNRGRLTFGNKEANTSMVFDIMFRKENGKWIITR